MHKQRDVGLKAWFRRHFGRQRTPKFYRGQEKFLARYPGYTIGIGSYGIPIVHDWHEGATLRIGAYTSIADDVHIFLGGQHRIDWVSSYPFPAFLDEARVVPNYGGTRGDVTSATMSGWLRGVPFFPASRSATARLLPHVQWCLGMSSRIQSLPGIRRGEFATVLNKKLVKAFWLAPGGLGRKKR